MSAAVIILRRTQFIRRFAQRGATSPEQAIAFADVGLRRSWIFDQMVARGVLVRVGEDSFYLNAAAATVFLAAQRRRALVIAAILLVLVLIFILASVRR